ncbi:MAG: class I SAM-dependent methyltransferase [Acidobacteriia bacterium]|nr:class I SAM-dependent methyltransferase [Terriglobia bacterium]
MVDPKSRFSSRVENYVRFRPGYPGRIVEILREECNLAPASVIADIGSGTGILAELFLKNGNQVYGVEPNREMREAGEKLLSGASRFVSVCGSAEATTLCDHSVDFVSAGQAFHWFDRQKAREEFSRILKPQGWIVLIWNDRRTDSTPFLTAYEELMLTYSIDYKEVDHKRVDSNVISSFFGSTSFKLRNLENQQAFDFEGLMGRVFSSSYAPERGHPNYEPMVKALATLFQTYEDRGQVVFEYDTRLYYGQLPADQG